ncbi:Mobile element protein [Methanosarcina barkeri str. Wiesmoor]|uniref:Mobile element protein n=1 Tax=Methanosarcina barkeri str. Wiesmoor TaxID=1434109 RepID=A0A0E3QMN0_METBA|nr:Mobile element protein [Methanosarcina barkeri str. Wiesmoor]
MDYLTSMKLNSSDNKIIENFDLKRAELMSRTDRSRNRHIWNKNHQAK